MRTKKVCFIIFMIISVTVSCAGCRKEKARLQEISIESGQEDETNEEVNVADSKASDSRVEEASEDDAAALVCVYVCGAVNNPGVYELEATGRIYEAIALAGGMTDTADVDYLNQAQIVTDGEQIYVPTMEETVVGNLEMASQGTGAASQESGTADTAGLVNLNVAGKDELMTLPGIGETKADAIISYRESSGGFTVIEDVMLVEGIKDSTFQKIKEQITI